MHNTSMSCPSGYVKDMANAHCILEKECLSKTGKIIKDGRCSCDSSKEYVLNFAQDDCWTTSECEGAHYAKADGD